MPDPRAQDRPDLPPPPELVPAQGERLVREVYRPDFRQRYAAVRDHASWKLERRQHFEEKENPSRDALRRGDWHEALRLLDENRAGLLESAREDAARGSAFHRARVVEKPLTPYMQWQLHSLRLRAECGERIRVIDAAALATAERTGPLPELVVLGGRTLYRVLYTASGAPDGAQRWTEPSLVARWERWISDLFAAGEDVRTYFAREVAPLPPPDLTTGTRDTADTAKTRE